MSEYIDNTTRRKDLIKKILKELNSGKSIDEVKLEFQGLLDDVDAPSITEVEQMLINEGTPAQEIQRLCDVHATFFKESLDQQIPPENIPGHPIHTFQAENIAVVTVLDDVKTKMGAFAATPTGETRKNAAGAISRLQEFDQHYVRKENLLFSVLERYGFFGPSQVMWGIHNDIRKDWKSLEELVGTEKPDSKSAIDTFTRMDTAVREMVFKEEKILFPTSLERLNSGDWQHILEQEPGIGYAYIQPGREWGQPAKAAPKPEEKPEMPEPVATAPTGLISLATGALAGQQIDLLLKTLPVDVTFVDENDQVQYSSQTKDRIFQRSPAIIGRKVQNCHPPQSLGKVQQILDDFREGKRDVAEFWIQVGDKFVVIQYFAVRDERGNYRGTIEVSQDASHLRSLQGEKRLLDDFAVE